MKIKFNFLIIIIFISLPSYSRLIKGESIFSIEETIAHLEILLGKRKIKELLEIMELEKYHISAKTFDSLLKDIFYFLIKIKREEAKDYEFLEKIILPLIKGALHYNHQPNKNYHKLILEEPTYNFQLEVGKFLPILEKIFEDVKSFRDTWTHYKDWWIKKTAEGKIIPKRRPESIRVIIEIFCYENDLKSYFINPTSDFEKAIFSLDARSARSILYFFKNATLEEIQALFPNIEKKDLQQGVKFLVMKALNLFPKTLDQWIERLSYQVRSFGKITDKYSFLPLWVQRGLLAKALIEEWGPNLGSLWGMDYYNWKNLKLYEKNVPLWRIKTIFFRPTIEIAEKKYDMRIKFLGYKKGEEGKYISLEGLYRYYNGDIYKMQHELKFISQLYFWVDCIRWLSLADRWDKVLPQEEKERVELLKYILAHLSQEKDVALSEINKRLFYTIRYFRRPGRESRNMERLIKIIGWDRIKEILEEFQEQIELELEDLITKVASGKKNIHWQNFHPLTLKKFVDLKYGKNKFLEANWKDIKGSIIEGLVRSLGGGPVVREKELALAKGILYYDFDLINRISNPYTTIDYLLRYYYFSFETLSLDVGLPAGVIREINQMLALKLGYVDVQGNPDLEQLKSIDYVKTYVNEFIDWMLENDPLNLLSPADKKLFEIAKKHIAHKHGWKEMTLYGFYIKNVAEQ